MSPIPLEELLDPEQTGWEALGNTLEMARRLRKLRERHRPIFTINHKDGTGCACGRVDPCPDAEILEGK